MTIYDVIVIGSGPAGLTAGVYTARANLKTLLIAGEKWGGQLMLTTLVENFPGFSEGIQGPALMENMRKQAERFGVEVVEKNVTAVDFSRRPFKVSTQDSVLSAQTVIIATGAVTQWLNVPGEQNLIGRGVSSCAPCDAPFFKDKKVIVIGGGDAAMEEAMVLSKFASQVTIVHRRDEFRASKIMQDRVLNSPKIKIKWNTEVKAVLGDTKVTGVQLMTTNDNRMTTYDCDGIFVAIGHKPASEVFKDKIELDEKFYAKREGAKYHTMSNVEGVFVAGDVHDYHFRQAITAAGYGCEAAIEAERWLDDQAGHVHPTAHSHH